MMAAPCVPPLALVSGSMGGHTGTKPAANPPTHFLCISFLASAGFVQQFGRVLAEVWGVVVELGAVFPVADPVVVVPLPGPAMASVFRRT